MGKHTGCLAATAGQWLGGAKAWMESHLGGARAALEFGIGEAKSMDLGWARNKRNWSWGPPRWETLALGLALGSARAALEFGIDQAKSMVGFEAVSGISGTGVRGLPVG